MSSRRHRNSSCSSDFDILDGPEGRRVRRDIRNFSNVPANDSRNALQGRGVRDDNHYPDPRYNSPCHLGPRNNRNGQQSRKHSYLQDSSKDAHKYNWNREKRMKRSTSSDHVDIASYHLGGLPMHPLASSPSLSLTEISKTDNSDASRKMRSGSRFRRDQNNVIPSASDAVTVGKKVTIEVNCWDFEVADVDVYRYDIQPEELQEVTENSVKRLRTGWQSLCEYMRFINDSMGDNVFSDGRRFYYSLEPLEDKFDLTKSQYLTLHDSDRNLRLKYVIKRVGTVSTRPIRECLESRRSGIPDISQDAINMLDNLLRWVNRKSFEIFKTGVYLSDPVRICSAGLFSIYKGYSFSVRPQWKLRVNVDLSYKATFPAGNLADILYGKYGDSMYDKAIWRTMATEIASLRAKASHYKNADTGKSYSRVLRMFDLSDKTADEIVIIEKNMSITEYFKRQYGIVLKYPDLPCVRIKKDKEEFLPMELLTVLPFQKTREEKGIIASEVVRVAEVGPSERFRDLERLIKQVTSSGGSLTSRMKLKFLGPKPIRVEARELPQPVAQFSAQSKELRRGWWNQEPFFRAASTFLKWIIILFPPHKCNNLQVLLNDLPTSAERLGLVMDRNPEVVKSNLSELPFKFQTYWNRGIELAVCVLTDTKTYPAIKRMSDLKKCMVTQCVKEATLNRRQVMDNLLLKINGKLGGLNWKIDKFTDWWGKEVIMVVGADVTHPSSGGRDIQKSVAAVVASFSPDLMKYFAVVKQQEYTLSRETSIAQECIDDMEGIFKDLLRTFGERNNRLPTKIILYRDGVSEGQFNTVLRLELGGIQRACTFIQPGYEPGITFIVVQKRHHIRFNPTGGKSGNVSAGTVVDTQITRKGELDFYLCSHEGIRGTSKPAHYTVIYDDNDWNANSLHLFSYYLCHAYMRCNRSVSYPAPTYYAHLAAFRARDWLKDASDLSAYLKDNKFTSFEEEKYSMFFL